MGRKSIIKFIYNRQTIQAKGLSMGRTLGAVAIVRYGVLSYVGCHSTPSYMVYWGGCPPHRFFFSRFFWVWNSGLLSRKLCILQCFSKVHRFFFVAFFKEKKAFVFSYASELFSSRTLWSLFLFLSRLVCRFKKFIAFLSSLATI